MRRARPTHLLALAAVLAACGKGKGENWLTYPGVAGHARYFPLTGTPHDPYQASAPLSCAGCHPGTSFTTFECTGCHLQAQCDSLHIGKVANYAWASPSCYACHKDGLGISAQVHTAQFFPIGTTSHPATCTDCHTDLSRRGDTTTLACAGCHRAAGVDARHTAVTGYTSSTPSPDCVRCHADDQVKRIADHQATFALLVGAAASGSPKHVTDCLACHDAYRADKTWGADFKAFNCLGCHSDQAALATTHAGQATYVYSSPACLGCHPRGQGHSAFFPIGAGEKHAGIACASCHTDLASPTNTANFACASCHQTLTDQSGVTDPSHHAGNPGGVNIMKVRGAGTLAWSSPNCLRCHADGSLTLALPGGGTASMLISSHPTSQGTPSSPSDHASQGCVSCHLAMRTDKTYATDWIATVSCSTCHD